MPKLKCKITYLCTIILFLVLFSINCLGNKSKTKISVDIYEKLFANLESAAIFKIDIPEHHRTIIEGDEVNILRSELKKIKDIKEYTAKASPFGGFKEGYHVLFLRINDENQIKIVKVLYSINNRSMIVNKYDVYQNITDVTPNIIVYEFKIPENIVKILEEHEAKLPKTGDFHTSWP